MTTDELKTIFQSYCGRAGDSPVKKLFGLEYENFVMIPKEDDTAKTFEPLQVEGDKGVFRILENLAELTKEDNDPLEKVYEKEMLLALKSPKGTKVTIEPGGQFELSDSPRNSLSESNESLQNYLKLLKKAVAEFGGELLFQGVQPLHELEKLPFFKNFLERVIAFFGKISQIFQNPENTGITFNRHWIKCFFLIMPFWNHHKIFVFHSEKFFFWRACLHAAIILKN